MLLEHLVAFMEIDMLSSKLISYSTSSILSKNRTFSPVMLAYVPIFLVAVHSRERLSVNNPYYNIFLNMYALFLFSVFALYESEDISVRIGTYFIFGFCMILPIILDLFKNSYEKYLGATVIIMLSLYSIRNLVYSDQAMTIMYRPYQSYLLVEMGLQISDAKERESIFMSYEPN
jgi:hypothetical protein